MLHVNLHRDMTIFLFFFFYLFSILFHGGFHVFKKNCLLFFAPYCVRIIRGFKKICITLHTRIFLQRPYLSLSLLSIFRILEIRIGEIKSLTFLIRNSRRLTILVQYFRRTKNNIKKSFLNEYYCKFKNSRSLFVIHGSNGLKRESKRKRKKFRGVSKLLPEQNKGKKKKREGRKFILRKK